MKYGYYAGGITFPALKKALNYAQTVEADEVLIYALNPKSTDLTAVITPVYRFHPQLEKFVQIQTIKEAKIKLNNISNN